MELERCCVDLERDAWSMAKRPRQATNEYTSPGDDRGPGFPFPPGLCFDLGQQQRL